MLELPELGEGVGFECLIVESYDALKYEIFEAERKVLCIVTEKVVNTSKYAPPMPSNVAVRLYKESDEGKVYVVSCPSKIACFDAVVNLTYQAYEQVVPSIIVFIQCPEMKKNEVFLSRVDDYGEVIDIGSFTI